MNWRRKLLPRKPVAPAPTVPWAMSQKPDPATAVPNEPTSEGRKVGAMLGALADAAEAEQRRDFPDMLPRCNDCAFRAGTLPNGCEETLMDAMKCAVEGKPFYYVLRDRSIAGPAHVTHVGALPARPGASHARRARSATNIRPRDRDRDTGYLPAPRTLVVGRGRRW